MLAVLLLYGVLLFILLLVLSRLLKVIPIQKSYKKRVLQVYPFVELLAWFLFVFYSLQALVVNQSLPELIILVPVIIILSFVAWFFLKDYTAGVFLRSEDTMVVGQRIKTGGIEGFIEKIGVRSVILAADSGEQIKIPYSKLSGSILSFPGSLNKEFYAFSFELELTNSIPYHTCLRIIRERILMNPWIIPGQKTKVSLVKSTNHSNLFKLEFVSFNEILALRAETLIIDSFTTDAKLSIVTK